MKTVKQRSLPIIPLLALGAWLTAHLCFGVFPKVFESWDAQTIDQLFALRDRIPRLRPPYDDTIVHVDFNNTTIRKLQSVYLSRRQHGQVIRNLGMMGVAAQTHDFIFAECQRPQDLTVCQALTNPHEAQQCRDRLRARDAQGCPQQAHDLSADDQALVHATSQAGHVYLGLTLALGKDGQRTRQLPSRNEDKAYVQEMAWRPVIHGDLRHFYTGLDTITTFSHLAKAAQGLGNLTASVDPDGVLRRWPLLVRYEDALYPTLGFQVICAYLGVSPAQVHVTPGKHIVLRGARRPGTPAPHDIVIPIDDHGQMVINYLGNWERLTHYHLVDIYQASEDREEMALWQEQLQGKIVVVADVSTGSSDVGAIPLDANFPLSGVHSNVMHTILTEHFLAQLSWSNMLLLEALLLAVLLVLAYWFTFRFFFLGFVCLTLGYIGGAGLAFLYGAVIVNVVRPVLMLTCAAIGMLAYRYATEEKARLEGLRQRDFVRTVFGRYLGPAIVEELLDSPTGLDMGGELREVTLLVSDLRGFTSLSSRLSPRDIIALLNRYFDYMLNIIDRYRGTVDELQGDGILAFFGAPLKTADAQALAVACALEMQLALREFNAEQQRLNLPELAMGIGLNTGEVVMGNIGSLTRTKYGAVGSAINMAYRIESHTVGGQILLSPSTYEHVQSLVHVRGTLEAQFKGLAQPLTLYDVSGIGGPYQIQLPDKPAETWVTLPAPLPIACYPVDGKLVSESAIAGAILRLAQTTADVTLEGHVAAYTNIKLALTPPHGQQFTDIYAKVLTLEPVDDQTTHVRLEFTSVPHEAKDFLARVSATPSVASH